MEAVVRTLRILYVEDDPAMPSIVAENLAGASYRVERVTTGRDALARLLQRYTDLLLLDLGLPDIDGMETCRLAPKCPGFTDHYPHRPD
jgi:DNA-binding response OmpR family regulator